MNEYLIDNELITAMANQIRRISATEETYNAAQMVEILQKTQGVIDETSGEYVVNFIGSGETIISTNTYNANDICAIPQNLTVPTDYTLTGFKTTPIVEIKNNYFIVPASNVNLDIQYNTLEDAVIFDFAPPNNSNHHNCYLPHLDNYTKIHWYYYTDNNAEEAYGNLSGDPTILTAQYLNWYDKIRAVVYGCTAIGAFTHDYGNPYSIKLSTKTQSFQMNGSTKADALSELIIPPYSITTIQVHGTSLQQLILPKGLKSLDYQAISGNSSLTLLYIPDTVTTIANGAIRNSNPEIIISPNNSVYHTNGTCIIDTAHKTLVAATNNCKIPEDGSVTIIGRYSLQSSAIVSIVIPQAITTIEYNAFANASNLTSAIYQGTEEEWENVIVEAGNDALTNVLTFAG